ncbi:hypothetical protein V1519DRAFT_451773 [Lipomyces tetrasporus]
MVTNRLVAMREPDLSVTLFGEKYPTPLVIAPVGVQRIFHRDGQLTTSRVAA